MDANLQAGSFGGSCLSNAGAFSKYSFFTCINYLTGSCVFRICMCYHIIWKEIVLKIGIGRMGWIESYNVLDLARCFKPAVIRKI